MPSPTVARYAAVAGKPVAHSLSPVLHRAAYRCLGLPWSYQRIECDSAQLPDVLASRSDWAGLSCTMPLKQVALSIADEVSDRARRVGAANTLVPVAGGWRADNTDVSGVLAALGEHDVRPATVTVLGAGGTANAVLGALAELRVPAVQVLARDVGRAAATLTPVAAGLGIAVDFDALDAPPAGALDAALVASTLPAGALDRSHVVLSHRWQSGQTVFDVVYDHWPTPLAATAHAGGAQVISGASLLLLQAVGQVELMTAMAAPVASMRAALREAVPHAGL